MLLYHFITRCQQSNYDSASLTFLDGVVDLYTDHLPSVTWEEYITSLATPLQQILELVKEQCLVQADATWSAEVLHWLGRKDLAGMLNIIYSSDLINSWTRLSLLCSE